MRFVKGLRPKVWLSLVIACGLAISAGASLQVQIGQNFSGAAQGTDTSASPADGNGAIGPAHFVEFVNGRYSVYNKLTGSKVQTKADINFWIAAGITFGTANKHVSDPRVIFDVYSQRWFASMVDFNPVLDTGTTNRFLLAVSKTSDPTGVWQGVTIDSDPETGAFADFATLGIDADAVYLSGDMFDSSDTQPGASLLSIPKSSLLANPPSTTGITRFGILDYAQRGQILQPVVTTGVATTSERVLAVDSVGIDFKAHDTLILSSISNAADTNSSAILSTPQVLKIPPFKVQINPYQPNGTNTLDNGDRRISSMARRVGDVIYAVNGLQTNNHAAIVWSRIDAVKSQLIDTGVIARTNLDLFFPSIAANEAGVVVIGLNTCSSNQFIGSYALVGEPMGASLSFGDLIQLRAGTASYDSPGSDGISRWGDYSATSPDPSDPNRFWTIQMVATAKSVWRTQITEIIVTPRTLQIATVEGGVRVSWPAILNGAQLESASALGFATQWSLVATEPLTSGNEKFLVFPYNSEPQFFRLGSTP